MQADQQLDGIDKKLLNEIQWVFPLVDRPYLEIANRHGISEQDAMHRIKALKKKGSSGRSMPFLTLGALATRAR